jgi:beta-N-acetylhexosaminidase
MRELSMPDLPRLRARCTGPHTAHYNGGGRGLPVPRHLTHARRGTRPTSISVFMSLRDIRQRVGQLAFLGFAGHTMPVELRAIAREFDLGGIILFSRNVAEPEQVAELAAEAQTLAREWPVWVAVDQEGGRVARLRAPFTAWPPMAVLGRSGDAGLAGRFARALATELAAVGVSLDFAPVLDVGTNRSNPAIGDRAIAERPEDVARLGSVIVRALQDAGIAACGKHFPGHGDTGVDSHREMPVVEHSPDRLRAAEFVPFRAAIEAAVTGIMTAHLLVPAVDEERPATLSRQIVHGLLRTELGFDGIIFTDDLEMGAISNQYTLDRAAVMALAAGCDAVLLCGTEHDRQAAALEAIVRAAEQEELRVGDLEDSLRRHRRAKERFFAERPRPAPLRGAALRAVLGRDEHQAIAREMAAFV